MKIFQIATLAGFAAATTEVHNRYNYDNYNIKTFFGTEPFNFIIFPI